MFTARLRWAAPPQAILIFPWVTTAQERETPRRTISSASLEKVPDVPPASEDAIPPDLADRGFWLKYPS
jgi:hypothetical protein